MKQLTADATNSKKIFKPPFPRRCLRGRRKNRSASMKLVSRAIERRVNQRAFDGNATQMAGPEAERCRRRNCRRPRRTQRARTVSACHRRDQYLRLRAELRTSRSDSTGQSRRHPSGSGETLRGHKFVWPGPEITKALQQLPCICERVQPTQTLDIMKTYPSANRILECAEAGKADCIVTGDKKHLLAVGNDCGIAKGRYALCAASFSLYRRVQRSRAGFSRSGAQKAQTCSVH